MWFVVPLGMGLQLSKINDCFDLIICCERYARPKMEGSVMRAVAKLPDEAVVMPVFNVGLHEKGAVDTAVFLPLSVSMLQAKFAYML